MSIIASLSISFRLLERVSTTCLFCTNRDAIENKRMLLIVIEKDELVAIPTYKNEMKEHESAMKHLVLVVL
jgi:hypothetical protein